MTDVVSRTQPQALEEPALTTRLAMAATFQEAFKRVKTVIAPLNTQGDKTPIFWVHSVLGSGTDPIRLSMLLGPKQPFYSIRVPNPLRNKAFGGSVESMADHYVSELIRFQPDGPIVLGAWSAGVVVALDMAQKLTRAGREVSQLIVVDFAPSHTGVNPGALGRLMRKAERLVLSARRGASQRRLAMQIWRWIVQAYKSLSYDHPSDSWARGLGLTEAETAFVRAFYDAAEVYVPDRYERPILLYTALRADDVKLNVKPLLNRDVIARWKAITPDLTTVELVGDHASIMIGDDVKGLASDLIPRLRKAPRRRPRDTAAVTNSSPPDPRDGALSKASGQAATLLSRSQSRLSQSYITS